jgi:hypothetical protein
LNWPPLSKPATPEETPGSTLFRQVGERRSDGFYFRGYQARPSHLGGRYECWASPTAWAQRAERRAAAERRYREKRDLDPKRRATSRAYAATHMVKHRNPAALPRVWFFYRGPKGWVQRQLCRAGPYRQHQGLHQRERRCGQPAGQSYFKMWVEEARFSCRVLQIFFAGRVGVYGGD